MQTNTEAFFSCAASDCRHYSGKLQPLMQSSFVNLMKFKDGELAKEGYKYVQLQKLFELEFNEGSSSFQEDVKRFSENMNESSTIYLSQGHFVKSTLDKASKIGVYSFDEALSIFPSLITSRLAKIAEEEKDPFALFNLSQVPYGMVLYVPPKTIGKTLIRVLDYLDAEMAQSIQPKILLWVGQGAEVSLQLETISKKSGHLYNRLIDIHLEADAKLKLLKTDSEASQLWMFDHLRASLKRDSSLSFFDLSFESYCLKQDLQISLLEEGAEAALRGLSLLQGKEQLHTKVLVKHLDERTTSHQEFKSVLFDHAKVSFEGKIWVDTKAQFTEAYQVCRSLILGTHATSFIKPNLEIFTDEVKASHGATIARLDEEPLFYLRSRGLSEKEAKMHLIRGFCQDMLDHVDYEPFSQKIREKLTKALQKMEIAYGS